MISKILGLIDLAAAVFIFLAGFEVVFTGAFVIVLLLLLAKSLIFIKNWASWIDMVAVILMALILVNVYPFINVLFVLWLLQKGAVSLFS